jgi:predicted TIM-barrel fold metal-dependent hydrolase
VYIQVNWPNSRELEEVEWVTDVATFSNWPMSIIAHADFASENCTETLRCLSQKKLVKGIRQQLHWHVNPKYRFASAPDIMMDATWRRNFSFLQDYGWLFELQVFCSQMSNAANLAHSFSKIPMVLQHCGMPEDDSEVGIKMWLDGIKRLSQETNVYCKFSGLGTFIHSVSPNFISEITEKCIELFGSERCIFGSNFPIEKLWSSYGELLDGYKQSLERIPFDDKQAIFYDNAKKLYDV